MCAPARISGTTSAGRGHDGERADERGQRAAGWGRRRGMATSLSVGIRDAPAPPVLPRGCGVGRVGARL